MNKKSASDELDNPSASHLRRFVEGDIEGVVVDRLDCHEDSRGTLIELYRLDRFRPEYNPAMAYVSETLPGASRGPHEHVQQSDYLCFVGPGTFKLYLWDARKESETYGNRSTFEVGENNRMAVLVPCGVVHAYKNVCDHAGVVFNCPNRLYAGYKRKDPVDEVRHELRPDSPYVLD